MRILLTNDDGYHAPGLRILEQIARAFSDLKSGLEAPLHGMSTAFTLAAVFDVAAFVVIAALLRERRPRVPDSPAGLSDGEEIAAAAVSD